MVQSIIADTFEINNSQLTTKVLNTPKYPKDTEYFKKTFVEKKMIFRKSQ